MTLPGKKFKFHPAHVHAYYIPANARETNTDERQTDQRRNARDHDKDENWRHTRCKNIDTLKMK